jgi:FAD-dependent urate hydroxylase
MRLSDYWKEQGRDPAELKLIGIGDFIDYGDWFQRLAAPDLDTREVTRVERRAGEFVLTLSAGEHLAVARVVVATGLGPFAAVPPIFRGLSGELVSHASAAPGLRSFEGRSVAIIGGGQSALESAALLHEAGAEVEVLARGEAIYWLTFGWGGGRHGPVVPPASRPSTVSSSSQSWRVRKGLYWRAAPTEVGGRLSSWVGAAPDVCRRLPRRARTPLTRHCIRPAGAYWLPDRLQAVKITLAAEVRSAQEREGRVSLKLDGGAERLVDHVLLGTGYEIDMRRYPLLAPELAAELRVKDGSPVLGRGLESSIAGLHFTGAPAAESFGPAMRFVVGTAYTAPALAQFIRGARRPLFRWAF